jgi:hypothetical protein
MMSWMALDDQDSGGIVLHLHRDDTKGEGVERVVRYYSLITYCLLRTRLFLGHLLHVPFPICWSLEMA